MVIMVIMLAIVSAIAIILIIVTATILTINTAMHRLSSIAIWLQGMANQRQTGPSDGAKLASQIQKFSQSKSFLKYYDDEAFTSLPGYTKEQLEPYIGLWKAINKPTSLKKSVCRSCMQELAKLHNPWGAKQLEKDWVEVMGRRLRNLVHHFSMALRNKAGWLVEEATAAIEKEPLEDTVLIGEEEVGWDERLQLGYRGPVGCALKDREMSYTVEDDPDQEDDAGITVEFENGDKYQLKHITFGHIRSANATPSQNVIWEAYHKKTKNKIWLAQRLDRPLLISVFEQGRQMTQIRADFFGVVEDQSAFLPGDHEILKKAKEFFMPLLEDLLEDRIKDKHELQAAKKQKIKDLGMLSSNKSKVKGPIHIKEKSNIQKKSFDEEKEQEKQGQKRTSSTSASSSTRAAKTQASSSISGYQKTIMEQMAIAEADCDDMF